MHPSFPQVEIDRYKTRTQRGVDEPALAAGVPRAERFQRAVFGDHPAARVSATPESLDALTREALVEFHKAHYVPDRAVLAIAGDITLAVAKQKVEAALGGMGQGGRHDCRRRASQPPLSGAEHLARRAPGSVQTSLVVGTQSIVRTDPDYEALTVANRVLGGPNGRLFNHLREQKGYTYGAGSAFSSGRYRGSWSASTDVRTEVTDPALHRSARRDPPDA